jgi:hypothetical protein
MFRGNAPRPIRVRDPRKAIAEIEAAAALDAASGAPSAWAEGAHPQHRNAQEKAVIDVKATLLERDEDLRPLYKSANELRVYAKRGRKELKRRRRRVEALEAELELHPIQHFGEGLGRSGLILLQTFLALGIDLPLTLWALSRAPIPYWASWILSFGLATLIVLCGHVVGSALQWLTLAEATDVESRGRANRRILAAFVAVVTVASLTMLAGLNELRVSDLTNTTTGHGIDGIGAGIAFAAVNLAILAVAAYFSFAHERGKPRRTILADLDRARDDLESMRSRRTKDLGRLAGIEGDIEIIHDQARHRCDAVAAWYRSLVARWYAIIVRGKPQQQVDELEEEHEAWARIEAMSGDPLAAHPDLLKKVEELRQLVLSQQNGRGHVEGGVDDE